MEPSLEAIDWQQFLRRPPLQPLREVDASAFRGRSILLTGAGGSIGTAIASRLARLHPARIILLEASESHFFALDRLFHSECGPTEIALYLGSVCDKALLDEIFSVHAPDLILHAAAFKQVPLLEDQPLAAIFNNALGTETLSQYARAHGARIVLLSTDKAVEPVSIMGATKRIAEQIILSSDGVALRLGNILGSRDSVAEVFAQQIRLGNRITVTDPTARRYFLTLDEAADLLLAASLEFEPPALLSPDLHAPHLIVDLAHFLAKELAPDQEIPVQFTQLRPGDKESESFWASDETVESSNRPGLLRIATRRTSSIHLQQMLMSLRCAVENRDASEALSWLMAMVPEYTPSQRVRAMAQERRIQNSR